MTSTVDVANFDASPNNLEAFWMPFTANRQFKAKPRLLVGAQDMHYTSLDNRKILDGTAGLWCVQRRPRPQEDRRGGARPGRPHGFRAHLPDGPPLAFKLASRLTTCWPATSTTCSSPTPARSRSTPRSRSPSPITACSGQGTRQRLIGRERGYHGVGFGGISVGGIVSNRKFFGSLLNGVDHLPHTHNLEENAFCKGQPELGRPSRRRARAHRHAARRLDHRRRHRRAGRRLDRRADPAQGLPAEAARDLRQARHPADLRRGHHRLRPPRRQLRHRVFRRRARHDHLRQGPHQRHHPDGRGVRAQGHLRHLHGDGAGEPIELFHGYTYSAHPVACAAGLATLDIYKEEGLFERANALADYWEDAVHSLKGTKNVIDMRNLGLIARHRAGAAPGQGRQARLRGLPRRPTRRAC